MLENVKRYLYIFLLVTFMTSSFRPNNGLSVIKNNSFPRNETTTFERALLDKSSDKIFI